MVTTLPRDSLPRLPKNTSSISGADFLLSAAKKGKSGWQNKMKILTGEVSHILEEKKFRSSDFWDGYKLYCFARYSNCRTSKNQFLLSKMGQVFGQIQSVKNVRWTSISDERVREIWAMMEEYADLCLGEDWKNLRSLMEEFDDVKRLSVSEKGRLLLQLIEDDGDGKDDLHDQTKRFKIQKINIFEDIRDRLNVVDSNLERLMTSSVKSHP